MPKKSKLETNKFIIGSWTVTGVTPIITLLYKHLACRPTFQDGNMVIEMYSSGEAAVADLMSKYPVLDVSLDLDLMGSAEESGELVEMVFFCPEL